MLYYDTTREFAIEWIKGDVTATVTAPSGTKIANSMKRQYKKRPEDVTEFVENKDGSICCHVPVNWIKVSPPRKVVLTDEERQKISERLQAGRGK